MAGIYIHIPFCRQACHYCNFHFSVNIQKKVAFIQALKQEIFLRKKYFHEKIETVYFGGGTPSLLSGDEINEIFETLHQHFEILPDAEITLEANPDDLTEKKLNEIRQTPVNRFSIGVQSFYDDDLRYLNRAHIANQAETSIRQAQSAGFENITIDLIYAIPGLTDEKWLQNLNHLNELKIVHFSAYCLTVEPKTALEKFIREKKSQDVSDMQGAHQFELLMSFAETNGYEHYEISNFSKPGFQARHNSAYWFGKKYLGLGPSAHSFDGLSRQWNIANNSRYIDALEKGTLLFEKEILSEKDRFNESIMTTLRTSRGVNLQFLKNTFSEKYLNDFKKSILRLQSENFLNIQNEQITLSRSGKLLADKIISELFADE